MTPLGRAVPDCSQWEDLDREEAVARRFLAVMIAVGLLLVFAAGNLRVTICTESSVRAVEQRKPLSEAERVNVEIFERVSSSVVQVVGQSSGNALSEETESS